MDSQQWNGEPGIRDADAEWERRIQQDVQALYSACHATASERWHVTREGTLCDACFRIREAQVEDRRVSA